MMYARYVIFALTLLASVLCTKRVDAAGLLFGDGFESGTTSLWAADDPHALCPVVTSATDGGLGPHSGTKMVRCRWDGGYESLVLNSLPYTNEIFYRAWLRIDTNMDRTSTSPIKFLRIFAGPNGSNYRDLFEGISDQPALTLRGNAGDNLIATYWGDQANGDVSASTTAWHKIEYYINHTTQNVKVWHDGILIKNETVGFNSTKWYPFYLTSNWSDSHDSTNDLYFDDIEIFSDNNTGASGQMSDATISSNPALGLDPNFGNQIHTFCASATTCAPHVAAHAVQMGYDWTAGNPIGGAVAQVYKNSNLKVLFNVTAGEEQKWMRFEYATPPTTVNGQPLTAARIRTLQKTLAMADTKMYDVTRTNIAVSGGNLLTFGSDSPISLGVAVNDFVRIESSSNTRVLKVSARTSSTVTVTTTSGGSPGLSNHSAGQSVVFIYADIDTKYRQRIGYGGTSFKLFVNNYRCSTGIDQMVLDNVWMRSVHGASLYNGLFLDQVNPNAADAIAVWIGTPLNPCIAGGGGETVYATQCDGQTEFIKRMRDYFNTTLGGGGTSGNPFRTDKWTTNPTTTSNCTSTTARTTAAPLQLIYGERGTATDYTASNWPSLNAGEFAGEMPYDVGGSAPSNDHANDSDWTDLLTHAGVLAAQGSWFGWYGESWLVGGSEGDGNGAQLLRVLPNWDKLRGATSKTWNSGTSTYTSSNSFANAKIAYSRHRNFANNGKMFVVRNTTSGGAPTITVAAGEVLATARCVDQFFVETTTCLSGYFSQAGTTITLGGSVVNGAGYVLYFQGAPTFLSAAVTVADQLDVCWNTGDALAMLPSTGSTGWTVTVAGVGKTPNSTSRQGNNCFRLIFAASTITTGTQTVTVAYTGGNITNGSSIAATAFTAQTATNTLAGGGTNAVLTQTRSLWRHLEGGELIMPETQYGSENGNLNSSIRGGKVRLRLKIAATSAAAPPQSFRLYYDRNDANYLPVTNSCGTSEVIYTDAPQIVAGTDTTEQLTSDQATNVACKVVESVGTEPSVTLAQNSETECEYVLALCTNAALGLMNFRAYTSTGAALTAYTVTPRLTIQAGNSERSGLQMTGGGW